MTNEEKANLISERYQTHTADFRNGVYNGALVVLNFGINWKHPGKGEFPEYNTDVLAILAWNNPRSTEIMYKKDIGFYSENNDRTRFYSISEVIAWDYMPQYINYL